MEYEVPKGHVLRPTLSTDMVQHALRWERQKKCYDREKKTKKTKKNHGPVVEKCCFNKFLMNLFLGKEDEDIRRQENSQS